MTNEIAFLRNVISHLESTIDASVYAQQALRLSLSESNHLREHAVATFRRMGHWEFASTFVTTLYGIFLILPLETLTIIGLEQERNIFLKHAAESLWGLTFFIAGVSQIIATWIDYRPWRMLNIFGIAAAWLGVAYLYFAIYHGSTAGFLSAIVVWCSIAAAAGLFK